MTTWGVQQSWVSLQKPPKKWAGHKHMRISKVMSSLQQKKLISNKKQKSWESRKSWVAYTKKKQTTHENQLITWEIQNAWVALKKKD